MMVKLFIICPLEKVNYPSLNIYILQGNSMVLIYKCPNLEKYKAVQNIECILIWL